MNIPMMGACDGYKTNHRIQYPDKTELVYSNFTPRGTRTDVDSVVFFGLQYFCKEYLQKQWNDTFFSRSRGEVVAQYKRRMDNYLGKDVVSVDHIGELHDVGYLPIEIRAVKEGVRVPLRMPMLTIHNTNPKFFWLTNYLETLLSTSLWLPCTSATTAAEYRKTFLKFAEMTGGSKDFVKFQGHDFSFRGLAGVEAACMSGAAHLLSFVGTDTVPAIDFLETYYGANSDIEMVGCSVSANEHATATLNILNSNEDMRDSERDFVRRMIHKVHPTGIVSLVSDSFDYWRMVTDILPELKNEIIARDGKVVIRPDSGDPVKIVCGDPDAPIDTPEYKGTIQCLWDIFGGTVNQKRFKVLDSHIGLIYGDSITLDRQKQILTRLADKGFASDNIVLGIGSYTYQYVTRDTHQFAVKATYAEVDGCPRNIYKSPKTDSGMKKSAKGLLSLRDRVDGIQLWEECK